MIASVFLSLIGNLNSESELRKSSLWFIDLRLKHPPWPTNLEGSTLFLARPRRKKHLGFILQCLSIFFHYHPVHFTLLYALSRQWCKNGFRTPPLPIMIQTNSEAQANLIFNALQPWITNNYQLSPERFVNNLLESSTFCRMTQNVGATPDGFFWVVVYGNRSGLYFDTYVFSLFGNIHRCNWLWTQRTGTSLCQCRRELEEGFRIQ